VFLVYYFPTWERISLERVIDALLSLIRGIIQGVFSEIPLKTIKAL
jgi:hypothetical protein